MKYKHTLFVHTVHCSFYRRLMDIFITHSETVFCSSDHFVAESKKEKSLDFDLYVDSVRPLNLTRWRKTVIIGERIGIYL